LVVKGCDGTKKCIQQVRYLLKGCHGPLLISVCTKRDHRRHQYRVYAAFDVKYYDPSNVVRKFVSGP
jgi:hypothetical protein